MSRRRRGVKYHLAHRLGLIGVVGSLTHREQKRTLLSLESRCHALRHEPRRPIPPRVVIRPPGQRPAQDEEDDRHGAQRNEVPRFTLHGRHLGTPFYRGLPGDCRDERSASGGSVGASGAAGAACHRRKRRDRRHQDEGKRR